MVIRRFTAPIRAGHLCKLTWAFSQLETRSHDGSSSCPDGQAANVQLAIRRSMVSSQWDSGVRMGSDVHKLSEHQLPNRAYLIPGTFGGGVS